MTPDERAAEIAAIKAKLERIDTELAAIQQAQQRQRVSWYVLRLTSAIVPDGSAPGMSIFTDWPPVAI